MKIARPVGTGRDQTYKIAVDNPRENGGTIDIPELPWFRLRVEETRIEPRRWNRMDALATRWGDGWNFGLREKWFHISFQDIRSEEHTSELQSHSDLVCRLLLEKKKKKYNGLSTY